MYVIVPCSGKKGTTPTKACELYTSDYFQTAVRVAKLLVPTDRILILSAKYGVIDLHTIVAPYDLRFWQPGCVTPQVVSEQLRGKVSKDVLYSLLYRAYEEVLIKANIPFTSLTKGCHGVGYCLHWLKGLTTRVQLLEGYPAKEISAYTVITPFVKSRKILEERGSVDWEEWCRVSPKHWKDSTRKAQFIRLSNFYTVVAGRIYFSTK